MKVPALLALLFLVPSAPGATAATADAIAADPPAAIRPYIKEGGRYDPGDYGWMRGRFAGATAAERQTFAEVMSWADLCRREAVQELGADLTAAGYPGVKVEELVTGPLVCRQVLWLPPFDSGRSFVEFARAEAQAAPIAATFLTAVRLAEMAAAARSPAMAERLPAQTIADQMLRYGTMWGTGTMGDAPPLSPEIQGLVVARIGVALTETDTINTAFLKSEIPAGTWPKRSEVGASAASAAWLLVQHADADPLFQLNVLHRMEPLVPAGEVLGSDYALLYDRVMLKLVGRQRYGTQFTCTAGRRAPQPLEDENAVARWRASAGLDTLAENTARIEQMYGPCPPG